MKAKIAKEIIYIEQGMYGFLNINNKNDVIGMITDGIGPCCHIIVRNKNNGSMILCHADPLTNLNDKDHGIEAWIKKVCPDKDYQNLEVHIGEPKNGNRAGGENPEHYFNQAVAGIMAVTKFESAEIEKKILIAQKGSNTKPEQESERREYGIVIYQDYSGKILITSDLAFKEVTEKTNYPLSIKIQENSGFIELIGSYLNEQEKASLCAYNNSKLTDHDIIKSLPEFFLRSLNEEFLYDAQKLLCPKDNTYLEGMFEAEKRFVKEAQAQTEPKSISRKRKSEDNRDDDQSNDQEIRPPKKSKQGQAKDELPSGRSHSRYFYS